MGKVIANLAMSLDGFIADPDDGCDELFGFYDNGDVTVEPREGWPDVPHVRAERDLMREGVAGSGCHVIGRRLYDMTNGWDGHPGDEVPIVVLTHQPPELARGRRSVLLLLRRRGRDREGPSRSPETWTSGSRAARWRGRRSTPGCSTSSR